MRRDGRKSIRPMQAARKGLGTGLVENVEGDLKRNEHVMPRCPVIATEDHGTTFPKRLPSATIGKLHCCARSMRARPRFKAGSPLTTLSRRPAGVVGTDSHGRMDQPNETLKRQTLTFH